MVSGDPGYGKSSCRGPPHFVNCSRTHICWQSALYSSTKKLFKNFRSNMVFCFCMLERSSLETNQRPELGHMHQLFGIWQVLMLQHKPRFYWSEAIHQHHLERKHLVSLMSPPRLETSQPRPYQVWRYRHVSPLHLISDSTRILSRSPHLRNWCWSQSHSGTKKNLYDMVTVPDCSEYPSDMSDLLVDHCTARVRHKGRQMITFWDTVDFSFLMPAVSLPGHPWICFIFMWMASRHGSLTCWL